jgi:hypothetical protein
LLTITETRGVLRGYCRPMCVVHALLAVHAGKQAFPAPARALGVFLPFRWRGHCGTSFPHVVLHSVNASADVAALATDAVHQAFAGVHSRAVGPATVSRTSEAKEASQRAAPVGSQAGADSMSAGKQRNPVINADGVCFHCATGAASVVSVSRELLRCKCRTCGAALTAMLDGSLR